MVSVGSAAAVGGGSVKFGCNEPSDLTLLTTNGVCALPPSKASSFWETPVRVPIIIGICSSESM